MLADLVAILWAPFLMCLVLTGIHAYLGVHVLAREVVFVDIAMAQIAALGATVAFLVGHDTETWQSYAYALAATIVGSVVLALSRSRRRHVSQEAVIGVVYAVSSAAAVLVADRAAHGAEQVRGMLVGNLLAVGPLEVAKVAGLYRWSACCTGSAAVPSSSSRRIRTRPTRRDGGYGCGTSCSTPRSAWWWPAPSASPACCWCSPT